MIFLKKNSNSSTKDLLAVVGGMVPFHDCHGCVVWCGIGIVFLTKCILQMGDSQILLKWAIVRWMEPWKALSQCSELVILFYWGEKKKIVIWALNDLNDKSEASSHLYTTFVREILLDRKLQIVCWIKGYEN